MKIDYISSFISYFSAFDKVIKQVYYFFNFFPSFVIIAIQQKNKHKKIPLDKYYKIDAEMVKMLSSKESY